MRMRRNFLLRLMDSRQREIEAHLVVLTLGMAVFIGLSIYHVVVLKHAFDPGPYGEGMGTMLAGGGAAAWGQGLQRRAEGDKRGGPDDEPSN